MKNQYFGDKNDFFKFDLALTLIEELKLKRFTYIPMLTHDKSEYDGRGRPDLADFLRSRAKCSDRNIKSLRSFMARKKYKHIDYHPYRDGDPFPSKTMHEERQWKKYFCNIQKSWLNQSLTLILIDPDTGLNPNRKGQKYNDEYLEYYYLNDIYTRMKSSSLLLVYQHLPPRPRELYFKDIESNIGKAIDKAWTVCVSNNVVAFFVIARERKLSEKAWNIIEEYAKRNYANQAKRTPYLTYKCGSNFRCA